MSIKIALNTLKYSSTAAGVTIVVLEPKPSPSIARASEIASTVQVIDIQEWKEEHGDTNIPDALKNLKDDDNPVCVIVQP